MDDDIQFGRLEESEPRRQLRPDQNRHYALVACGSPSPTDLPIYLDCDVARDIEAHALSNTKVELGGVLLGGQCHDQDGQPFVVITDILRAEHYEASKGSFKFTHETWSDITRKREEFPDETQLVGWYHTHPGWGVFLSGMDTFICDHFFNKPLDVALVVDPCQAERCFFRWTQQDGSRRLRPAGGFYVTSSRFRMPELSIFKAQLEGAIAMPNDPRYAGVPGAYPPSVVQVTEPRQPWLAVAVLGMLVLQFSLLALIAWRISSPAETEPVAATEVRAAQLQAQRELLDQVIGELDVAPQGVVEKLEEERRNNRELETVRLGLSTHIDRLEKSQRELEREKDALLRQHGLLRSEIAKLKKERGENQDTIAALQERLKAYKGGEDEHVAGGLWGCLQRWKWYISGVAMLILVVVAVYVGYRGAPPPDRESEPDDADE